jgi:large conductance mechanosensitive channel
VPALNPPAHRLCTPTLPRPCTVNGSHIRYGAFLTAFVAFLLLAFVIMLIVQAIRRATGREAAGAQGSRECDHCKSFIPVDATVCMFCTRDVEPIVS